MWLFRRTPNIERLNRDKDVGGLCQALIHQDPAVRADAAIALGDLRDSAAIEPLIAALSDPYQPVRNSAIEALARIQDPQAIGPLLEIVIDPSRFPLDWCAGLLSSFGAPAVEPIMAALDSGRLSKHQALAILRAMGQNAASRKALEKIERDIERDIDDLAQRLTDATDRKVRKQALEDLNSYAGGWDLLGSGFRWKPRTGREAVWTAIVQEESRRSGGLHGAPKVSPYFHKGDRDHQLTCYACGAASSLLSYGAQEVAGHLLAALDRKDIDDRVFLVELLWVLADQLDESFVEPLAALAEGGGIFIAYYATCALINVKSDEVLPVLARIARSSRTVTVGTIVGTETSPNDSDEIWPVWGTREVDNAQRRIAEKALKAKRSG